VYCLDSSGLGYDPSAESYEYGNILPLHPRRVGAVNYFPIIAFSKYSHLSSVDVNGSWRYTSCPAYAFMVFCLSRGTTLLLTSVLLFTSTYFLALYISFIFL
jgi:hypothetical protein